MDWWLLLLTFVMVIGADALVVINDMFIVYYAYNPLLRSDTNLRVFASLLRWSAVFVFIAATVL